MSFFPDIDEDGKLKDDAPAPELYTPKATSFHARMEEEKRLEFLNNLGREKVTEDFSDSPHLDI